MKLHRIFQCFKSDSGHNLEQQQVISDSDHNLQHQQVISDSDHNLQHQQVISDSDHNLQHQQVISDSDHNLQHQKVISDSDHNLQHQQVISDSGHNLEHQQVISDSDHNLQHQQVISDSDHNLQHQQVISDSDHNLQRQQVVTISNYYDQPQQTSSSGLRSNFGSVFRKNEALEIRNREIFRGNDENYIKNGETLLKERISLFDGRTNPIRCFSVDDLNSMNILRVVEEGFHDVYAGVWDGNLVMVKGSHDEYGSSQQEREQTCREIAVATQMGAHSNVHRLLGFCLDTKCTVLVYEWAENGTLEDRIFKYKKQNKQPLEWKDRLRIAWEIAHAVSYLHNAFRRPIIHRNLKPRCVFLDQDDSARLSDFSLAISIPEGKKHVEDVVLGTVGYVAPEYLASGRLAESADVFSFGALLLVLMSGKPSLLRSSNHGWDSIVDLVNANSFCDIVDPVITTNRRLADGHFECHLKAFIELAVRCRAEDEERRPTMVEVATELKSMIMSSSASL